MTLILDNIMSKMEGEYGYLQRTIFNAANLLTLPYFLSQIKSRLKGDKFLELITSRQYMAMVAITHLPEDEKTLNNIARKLGTTKQSVKQLITIVENKGYVNVIPSKKNKRAVNLKITESGKKKLLVVAKKGIYLLEETFKNLLAEELETMWDLLKKLYSFDGEEHDGFEEEGNLIYRDSPYSFIRK
ncbi:MarR family winged helix-turn-helix transcriptional regulator [Pseudogracilibacillus sp. SO30301A]|uniref:MarR family winged helix-turn-helix transcriptional regulator n=1 Tax=Pseudogracilibacillus sp. SO30301A TaxID=3098291 RepID=UPI00300DFC5B